MSTLSSIWLGLNERKQVHIYWELAERETVDGKMTGAPIYLSADDGNPEQEVSIRLPQEIAMRLLIALEPNWTKLIGQVL